jgi:hypothetical protein
MELPINKVFYYNEDVMEMTGFTKRQLMSARRLGYLRCMPTRPRRYTKNMIIEFLENIEEDPTIMMDKNLNPKK